MIGDNRINNSRYAFLYSKRPEPHEIESVHATGVKEIDIIEDLRTHNEKIARAALETGFAQGYSREGFGSKQEYEEYVEMKLSDFLQSSEYKELVGVK